MYKIRGGVGEIRSGLWLDDWEHKLNGRRFLFGTDPAITRNSGTLVGLYPVDFSIKLLKRYDTFYC